MKNIYLYLIFYGLFQITIGCKSTKPLDKSLSKPLPEAFGSTKDSTNSSMINWKDLFKDQYLLDLIDIAIKNNNDVLIALQKTEAAKANARLSKNQLLPELWANISGAQRKYGLYTMDGAGNISTEITPGQIVPIHLPDYYLGLQTSWEVDVWGKLRNKKKASFMRYLSSVEGKNLVITNLIAEVGFAYYELLALDNKLDLIRETIKLQEDALDMVKLQKEVAAVNLLAVKEFEAHVLNSKAVEFEILQNITATENKINFLLNRFPQKIIRDKTKLKSELPTKLTVGTPADLLRNRPDIRQAEYNLLAAKADVKSAKAAFFPTINIAGGIGYQAFNTQLMLSSPESMAYSLIASLVAPILNRGEIKAQFKTANAQQLEALYDYQKNIINAFTEVFTEISNIKEMEQYHKLKMQEISVQNEAYNISVDLFKTGMATYIDVLLTQQNALQSKSELIEAKKRQFISVINMYKALGGGWR